MAAESTGRSHKLAAVLAVIGLALALQFLGAGNKRTSVPWLLGLSEAQAEKRLEERALEPEIVRRPRGAHRLQKRYRVEGDIVFQDYRRGITLPADSTVRVVVYRSRADRGRDRPRGTR